MAQSSDNLRTFVSQICLVDRGHGAVKSLGGFKKQHHTVPDAVNGATAAFLGKLCAGELAEEAEEYFQRARSILGYKRTELSLEVASPTAVLTAKGFTLEWAYALEKADPATYTITRTLHSVTAASLLDQAGFNDLFAARFTGITFMLTQGVSVAAVIDAIEACAADDGLAVSYPSDCRHCVLTVTGVDAEVVCDGASLEMRFPRPGAPRELVTAFKVVRSAFSLARDPVLSGLL